MPITRAAYVEPSQLQLSTLITALRHDHGHDIPLSSVGNIRNTTIRMVSLSQQLLPYSTSSVELTGYYFCSI